MVITGLICVIGSAAAATNIWVESNVKGVGHLTSEYEVDTEYGLANGIEMQELESGSGLVTKQKWMEKKCVKNYDLGAVTDANFIECEKLQKKESVVTYGNGVWMDQVWDTPTV